jgi:hypothetical protein
MLLPLVSSTIRLAYLVTDRTHSQQQIKNIRGNFFLTLIDLSISMLICKYHVRDARTNFIYKFHLKRARKINQLTNPVPARSLPGTFYLCKKLKNVFVVSLFYFSRPYYGPQPAALGLI